MQHKRFARELHDEKDERERMHKEQWRERLQQRGRQLEEELNPPMQQSFHRQRPISQEDSKEEEKASAKRQQIKSEMVKQSAIYATMQKSLDEKYHVQWQLDQLRLQKQQRLEGKGERLFPLMNENDGTTESERYPHPHELLAKSLHPQNNRHNRNVNRHNINNNRRLEDSFEDAYSTGRPGSTYGYNMFCGSSWAEASTTCDVRQNCPSGQNDECITPGHECWAFTECDTRRGDGEQFSEFHDVEGASNLQASGVGAQAGGGYVDLSRPSPDKADHYFCGKGYDDAVSKCSAHCPSGSLNDCPSGEICFFNTPCDARMMTGAPAPPSPTQRPTTPAPVVYASKLNKYFCGHDWDDAQER